MDNNTEKKAGHGRCLLITGGSLEAAFAASWFHQTGNDSESSRYGALSAGDLPWDHVIAADAGLKVCQEAGIFPDHIVGDFDSLILRDTDGDLLETYERTGSVIHRFKPEKAFTDTQIGAELALKLGCDRIVALGGTGSRIDHVLGNLQTMELVMRQGADMILVDPANRISMHREAFRVRRAGQWGDYISLIPWGGGVKGLTLRGFKYPLTNADFPSAGSLGISNELTEDEGVVTFAEGTLIMVEARDLP